MDRKKIFGIGEMVWDVYGQEMKKGGAPINFAWYCLQLGGDADIISAVGKDADGEKMISGLSSLGLNVSNVQINDNPTGRVEVVLSADGVPTYDIARDAAWDNLAYTDMDAELAAGADAVCWGTLAQRSVGTRGYINSFLRDVPENCLKIFDINLRQNFYDEGTIKKSLEKADVLKINEDELVIISSLYGLSGTSDEVISELMEKFALKFIVYTCGDKFSEIFSAEGEKSHIDTPKVDVVDTVGAGDSFTAAFVSGYLQGKSLAEIHRSAVKVSAYVCTVKGAINPLPDSYRI